MKFCFKNISVLGDGGWGTTLAILLHRKGCKVTLWSAFEDYARLLDKMRTNPNYLKGVKIPVGIKITSDLKQALKADLVVVAAPSQYLRSVLLKGKPCYDKNIPVVSVVKGIDNISLSRMSEIIKDVWKTRHICVLSGPTIAQEVARGIPTTAVASSKYRPLMLAVQDLFMTPYFRIYSNPDIAGVELGGSLKNIIAIACGISDGLGFGTNAKAAIVSRGLAEMSRLGRVMGASKETFSGISGLGDLVTTCFNPLSRNHFVGYKIARGMSLKQVAGHMKMVAEGVPTARSAYRLARKYRVDTPLMDEIYRVLFKNKSPLSAVGHLMMREKKSE
ncbi:MAG TPA: glycerol-3-phosphate dehydrogenase [Candidatus Omnitrophica bacterium]|nr:glycerol-3-phosphate dehydrogenase [Candidatus Omnitrophota bacterium]